MSKCSGEPRDRREYVGTLDRSRIGDLKRNRSCESRTKRKSIPVSWGQADGNLGNTPTQALSLAFALAYTIEMAPTTHTPRTRALSGEREREDAHHLFFSHCAWVRVSRRRASNSTAEACGNAHARDDSPNSAPLSTGRDLWVALDSYLRSFQVSDLDFGQFQRLARFVAFQNTRDRHRPTPSQPLSNANGIINRSRIGSRCLRRCDDARFALRRALGPHPQRIQRLP